MTIEVRRRTARDDLSEYGDQFGPDRDSPRRRRTVVARSDGQVVGAACATWSTRHPDYGFADLVVIPGQWHRGIETSLLSALEAVAGGPLMFNIDVAESDLAQFLQANGHRVVVESETIRLVIAAALGGLRARPDLPLQLAIVPASMTAEIKDLYETVYAERHVWAGAYRPTPGQPWISFGGDVVAGTLFVARDAHGPIAATCVQVGPFAEGADGFLAPTGVCGRARSDAGTDVIAGLLHNTLAVAAASGLVTLNVEYDSPYVELRAALSEVPREVVSRRRCFARP